MKQFHAQPQKQKECNLLLRPSSYKLLGTCTTSGKWVGDARGFSYLYIHGVFEQGWGIVCKLVCRTLLCTSVTVDTQSYCINTWLHLREEYIDILNILLIPLPILSSWDFRLEAKLVMCILHSEWNFIYTNCCFWNQMVNTREQWVNLPNQGPGLPAFLALPLPELL